MRPPERNPFELCFCLIFGLSMISPALGRAPLPNSLASISDVFGQAVAIVLLLGSTAVSCGVIWPDRDTGIPLQQWGCVPLFLGFLAYTYAVIDFSNWDNARIAAAACFGLAIGSAVRWIQFQLYVRKRKLMYGSNSDSTPLEF